MCSRTGHTATTHGIIAILLPCLLTGGTEVATLETARAFQSRGYTVEVVVYFNEVDSTMLETFKTGGIGVHFLGVQRDSGVLMYFLLASGLLRALARGRYDAIWLQYMTPTLLPLGLARLFTRNVIVGVHVAASHFSPASLRRLRWLARHWCARFVCVSHTVFNGIFGTGVGDDIFASRVVVIPNSLDMAKMRAAVARDWRSAAGWSRDVVVVGFAGRLAYNKGPDMLVHAIALLHKQGLPVRLVVVGDGPEQSNLETLVHRLGLGAIVYFSGRLPRAEIYDAIKGFDIAAVPSREEGFGLSALEAMAAGVPVVASRVDALEEVVLDGLTGLLCKAEDQQSLVDALARLVEDMSSRRAIGSAGIVHAQQNYDISLYNQKISMLIEDLKLP